MKRGKSHVVKAYIRLELHTLKDEPPVADAAFLASRGIEESAPIVLHHLRRHVLPLVRGVKPDRFWFLVHSRQSGVPTSEDDRSAYIDLTMVFDRPRVPRMPSGNPWVMRKEVPCEVIGTDKALPAGWKNVKAADVHALLHAQAELVLKFLEIHGDKHDDFAVLQHLRQFLHYMSNVAQMRIS